MVYLIGAGGHGKVVLEALLLSGAEVVVLDADPARVGTEVLGRKVIREEQALASVDGPVEFVAGVGDGSSRKRIVERWEARGHRLLRVVHPSAVVSPTASIEAGVVIMAGAVVQTGAVLAKGALVNTGATVDHDCRIGPYAHVAPGAHLAGNVVVGECAWIGIGAAVREGVDIGACCVVGAGAVVVDDLPPGVVAYGNPCRVAREIGKDHGGR
jgi:sugar O-acyltransferase (sialic acid O-acetyltransferase NeuD family)